MTTITAPTTAPPEREHSSVARTVVRLTGMELRLMTREPMVAVGLIAFPLVTVLVLAGVFGQTPDPDFAGIAPDHHYIAGYVGVVLASLGLITIPVHIATHRELGVLRRFRAAGVSARIVVASEVLLAMVLATIASVVVVTAGTAVYGMTTPEHPLALVGWFAAGLACFVAIGVALGFMLPGGRAASAIGNLVFVPMFLLGGGGPPRKVMTGVMHHISDVLPLSHIIGGLRQSWLGTTQDPHTLWYPAAIAVIFVALAIRKAGRVEGPRR
jgi:ABC-2 type transport system permease protein